MEKNSYYKALIKENEGKSKTLKNTAFAALGGGLICLAGELFSTLFIYLGIKDTDAYPLVTLLFIFLAAIATALGFFDKIATKIGAGALVPVTGFSNAVISCAIDTRSEGLVGGVGTKIFTVAGPVILYSSVTGVLYAFIYYLYTLI